MLLRIVERVGYLLTVGPICTCEMEGEMGGEMGDEIGDEVGGEIGCEMAIEIWGDMGVQIVKVLHHSPM